MFWCADVSRFRFLPYLDISPRVKPVKLVEQFKHGSLNFAFASRIRVVSFGSDRVDFVHEDDGGCVLFCHAEKFANQLRTITQILLDQFRADDA